MTVDRRWLRPVAPRPVALVSDERVDVGRAVGACHDGDRLGVGGRPVDGHDGPWMIQHPADLHQAGRQLQGPRGRPRSSGDQRPRAPNAAAKYAVGTTYRSLQQVTTAGCAGTAACMLAAVSDPVGCHLNQVS